VTRATPTDRTLRSIHEWAVAEPLASQRIDSGLQGRKFMNRTYRAVQVTEPGKFELVSRPIPEASAGKVRLRVEACGICHTDAGTVYNAFPGLTFPRVPGHEVVGRIDAC
jgi:hypothetical protein